MYAQTNFKTKKELKEAVRLANSNLGEPVTYFQPGPFSGNVPQNGDVYLEGPHYPQPHKWYAKCVAKDGVIVKVS